MQPSVRSLDQIISEINSVYEPQIQSVRKRQSALPDQIRAEEQGLQARQNEAFDSILSGARRRGLGFSGIPLGEQARYTATEYLPALARLRQSGREQAMSLEDAILGIQERRQNQALGIRQYEQQRFDQWQAEQERLAEARRQAAAATPRPSFGRTQAAQTGPTISRKQDGGFAFSDTGGRPISAASYAQQTGQDIRDVLYQMGQAGDAYSQQVYNQLVSDPFFGKGDADYDRRVFQTYSPLFWGTF